VVGSTATAPHPARRPASPWLNSHATRSSCSPDPARQSCAAATPQGACCTSSDPTPAANGAQKPAATAPGPARHYRRIRAKKTERVRPEGQETLGDQSQRKVHLHHHGTRIVPGRTLGLCPRIRGSIRSISATPVVARALNPQDESSSSSLTSTNVWVPTSFQLRTRAVLFGSRCTGFPASGRSRCRVRPRVGVVAVLRWVAGLRQISRLLGVPGGQRVSAGPSSR
jgi:hypothetical protein